MKKPAVFLFALVVFAAGLSAENTVTLSATVVSGYGALPDLKQLAASPFGERPFEGFEWEVTIGRVGLGGTYAADFTKDALSDWWLDWYGVPLFVDYHLFEGDGLLDPFVEAGVGCAGRVFTSTGDTVDPRLLISIFPALSAGLNIDLRPLVIGGKLTWVPGTSEIPCTSLLAYPLGQAQIAFTFGLKLGGRRGGCAESDN